MYSKSPRLPQFQQSAGATPLWSLWSSVTSFRPIVVLNQAFILYLPFIPSVLVLRYLYFCRVLSYPKWGSLKEKYSRLS
jgi:hypothetical protein